MRISDNDDENYILGCRLFTQDEQLLKYIGEVAKEKSNFLNHLKSEIFKSRTKCIENEEKDKKIVNFAANSISILAYADISFAGMNLTQI